MSPAGVRGRKRFWAGALCALIGAGGLYFGRALDAGTLAAPGPAAFTRALSALALAYGAVEFLRGLLGPHRPIAEDPPLWQRPGALLVAAAAIAPALLAFFGPSRSARAGPPRRSPRPARRHAR